jgi:LysR family hydrogen peroxide-inducible transcriptional activator
MERPSLRQLECVVAVADHLNFRRAAEACFITQPALSAQVQQLETMLGVRLFERDRRRVLVTPAGEPLVLRARAALAEIDSFVDTARVSLDPLAGTIRLGVIPTVAPYVLPLAIPAIRKDFGRLRLLLREDQTARLVELTQRGQMDLCLLALEADLGDLETMPLYCDPFVLALPASNALASRKSVREQELADEEVLLLEDGHCLREQTLSICQRAKARELDDFRASSLNTLVRMVSSGIGVTLLPSMALGSEIHARDKLAIRPLDHRVARTIGLAWRRSCPRGQAFAKLGHLFAANAPAGATALPRARR